MAVLRMTIALKLFNYALKNVFFKMHFDAPQENADLCIFAAVFIFKHRKIMIF